ncbi:hypothetical protein QBC37DRAFT_321557 [Rhypophila decipiens]|uniref:C2H2-type domain-containing protein n=1 Tax=Rhypophila decipiens TaxID=261697 RepID=A0AAN6Y1Z9_9PEZI|nr:hypothetical protein QBC37DRAFT_321557 [Rhypophila decipiens]
MAEISRTETIDITNDDNNEEAVDAFATTVEIIFRTALEDFKTTHPDQCEIFTGKGIDHVKRKIIAIQSQQERHKTMMNFARIQSYLERFAEFDSVCKSAKIGGEASEELSEFIWGPTTYILQISQEDHTVLDFILDAYERFGQRIPAISVCSDLIREKPNMIKCIAFMYHDLLKFYQTLVRFLTGRGWRKRFQANWKDYQQSFETLLKSFDAHAKVLKNLLDAWQRQASKDTSGRLDDHIMRTQDNHSQVMMQQDQIGHDVRQTHQVTRDIQQQMGDHVMRSQDDHEFVRMQFSLNNRNQELLLQSSRDITRHLNDQTIRANDNHQELQHHIDQYQRDRVEMLNKAKEDERRRKEDKRHEVLTWMSTPGVPQSEYHAKFKETRAEFPDTGLWILFEEKIFNWMIEEVPTHSMLWLNGKKGAGKTILASLLVDKCMEVEEFKTSYFYCREDDSNQNTYMSIQKGLLRQMVIHEEEMIATCHEKKIRGEERLNNMSTVTNLLDLFCEFEMNQFIIIDGLDECSPAEIRPLIKYWTDVVAKCDNYNPGKIRILLVSQDMPEIRKQMQPATIFNLHPDQSDTDIRKYVAKRFLKLQDRFKLTDDETRLSRELICSRSEGMFLYAFLTMKNLLDQATTGDVKDEIKENNLPATLEIAYRKIIDRLQRTLGKRQWEMARKLFGWLAGAKRPLQWHEIQAALSIRADKTPGEEPIDYHNNQLRRDIREICGSLVQVLEDRIEFIHSTTRSHIVKSEHLDERLIEYDLTRLCLRYLTLPCFRPDITDENIKHYAREGWYSFQDYAISKWKLHLENLIRITFPLFLHPQHGANCTEKFGATLAEFLAFHQGSIAAAAQERQQTGSRRTTPGIIDPAAPAQFCQPFQGLPFHQDLVSLWTHVCKHQTSEFKERNRISLPQLATLVERIRTSLESLSLESRPDSINGKSLRKFYGHNFFKCQRITCDYFHEGFDTKAALDKHSNRHDRPFPCPVQGCSIVAFGFSTNKDRDKHIRLYHPDDEDAGPARFVAGDLGELGGGKKTAVAKWECDLCPRKFTRQANLKAHVDNHFGTRNHACETCGKMFTRAYDRNRHRKIHVRRPVVRGG